MVNVSRHSMWNVPPLTTPQPPPSRYNTKHHRLVYYYYYYYYYYYDYTLYLERKPSLKDTFDSIFGIHTVLISFFFWQHVNEANGTVGSFHGRDGAVAYFKWLFPTLQAHFLTLILTLNLILILAPLLTLTLNLNLNVNH